jgi:hypothetical protein
MRSAVSRAVVHALERCAAEFGIAVKLIPVESGHEGHAESVREKKADKARDPPSLLGAAWLSVHGRLLPVILEVPST